MNFGRMLKHRLKMTAALAPMPFRHRGGTGEIVDALARRRFQDLGRMARTVSRAPGLGAEKLVSHKFRYLWICNPKVASRSIAATLFCMDPDAEVIFDRTISQVYAMRPEARSYYSFAFIRHPFDRALSWYTHMRSWYARGDFSLEHANDILLHLRDLAQGRRFADNFFGLAEVDSFDDYCAWLNTPWGSDAFANMHFLSQNVQIRLDDGRLPDFIGRLENIDEDFERVAAHVGMPAAELPRLNTMPQRMPGRRGAPAPSAQALTAARAERSALLTARNEALLRRRYPADLKLHESVSEAGGRARPSDAALEG